MKPGASFASRIIVLIKHPRFEADHVGMIMMACSGYDPSCAVSVWHEFDTIIKRQMLVTKFFSPIVQEIQSRLLEIHAASKNQDPNNTMRSVVMSMVKDKKLEFLDKREKRLQFAVLPGYVSQFPLEPSIHPYDGVFTGRITVGDQNRSHLRCRSS
jgi:hypothetical protein